MSKIENKFATIFQQSHIKFVREKTLPDLKKGLLRFDFYLPELGVLCEVDSMLHFQPIPKFHKTPQSFKHAQQNDRLKNSYALSHNIALYRIPEWEFQNIHTITDILQPKFRVNTKWWNDIIWREHCSEVKNKK